MNLSIELKSGAVKTYKNINDYYYKNLGITRVLMVVLENGNREALKTSSIKSLIK